MCSTTNVEHSNLYQQEQAASSITNLVVLCKGKEKKTSLPVSKFNTEYKQVDRAKRNNQKLYINQHNSIP